MKLDQTTFNEWIKDKDTSIQTYPEAGFNNMINFLADMIGSDKNVLNIARDGDPLTELLETQNCKVSKLYLDNEVDDVDPGFDIIVSIDTFHHFDLEHKVRLFHDLMELIDQDQMILIGDISFERRLQYMKARDENINIWDRDAHYFIYDEIYDYLREFRSRYIDVSFCMGILVLRKPHINREDSSGVDIAL